ncbi:hypothetical protein E2562_005242 [Oryza meyeriana var. granulata]|uniref:Uncharacterized protein n=1 Tax=Oryza meyeriana var. granulata TaxID=110450 RepID=A0A6G1EEP6_9ORYZ|nr:hypothetical protein E2562_005242 [Oryza meyeriana var. granulata]
MTMWSREAKEASTSFPSPPMSSVDLRDRLQQLCWPPPPSPLIVSWEDDPASVGVLPNSLPSPWLLPTAMGPDLVGAAML